MHLIFMNTFQKQSRDQQNHQAQVSICEQSGSWLVQWSEEDGSSPLSQTVWFQGASWEELISAFRHGIAVKMGDGYVPVLDGMLEERRTGTGSYLSMLHCYGELHGDAELFNALRDWRRSKAAEEKKAAYLIVNNRILWMISAFVPRTPEELLQIPGWGEGKNKLYGSDILGVTHARERTGSFPLDWVAGVIDPEVYAQWLYKQKEDKFRGQMERHQDKRRILDGIREGRTLSELQASLEIPRRELLLRMEELETEGYYLGQLVDRELTEMPETEQEKIINALKAVGDRYLKPLLKEVYGEAELQGKPLELFYERLRLVRLRYRIAGRQAI
jgi:hypothetical protein